MTDLRESPHYRADAPGARLDDQPWARSWPAFLAAINNQDDASARRFIMNAWTERVPSEGGFLVPEQLRAQVLEYITPAVVRPRAMQVPMGSLVTHLPVLDNEIQDDGSQAIGGLTFSFVENDAAIPTSTPTFGRMRLEAQKLAALVGIPNELNTDAAGALGDFISRVVAIGYSWAEDDYFINGTGAGQPQGVLNAACAKRVTRAASAAVGSADVAGMVSSLHPASLAAGLTPGLTDVGWLVSESVLAQILQAYLSPGGSATDTTTALPSWLYLGDGHDVGPSILGLPAFVSDHSPALGGTGDIALVDFRNYAIGDRLELTVDRSAAGSGFVTDVTNYRFKARVDGRYFVPGPVTPENSSSGSTVSPVVVLGAYES